MRGFQVNKLPCLQEGRISCFIPSSAACHGLRNSNYLHEEKVTSVSLVCLWYSNNQELSSDIPVEPQWHLGKHSG